MPNLLRNRGCTLFFFVFLFVLFINSMCGFYSFVSKLNLPKQAEYLFDNPQPLPPYVNSVSPAPKSISKQKNEPFAPSILNPAGPCIDLYEGADELWETGDPPEKGLEFWQSHMILMVDRHVHTARNVQYAMWSGGLILKLDQNRNVVRQFSGGLTICFDIDIPVGLHIATVYLTTTSGKQLSYSWAFQIK